MKMVHMVAWILVIIGGLNWLLIAVGVGDVVAMILGAGSNLARIVYLLVGLSAVYEIVMHKSCCKMCGSGSSM